MNLYSTTIETLVRLAARYRARRVVERKTYVFIFVPIDFRAPDQPGTGLSRPDEPELNFDLMWTWFLPNPLWPPKDRE